MGQYYYAAIIRRKKYDEKKEKWLIDRAKKLGEPASYIDKLELYHPFDYDNNLLKLMEHSYWGNKYAMTVESQLIRKKGRWEPPNFAVIGDYAKVDHYYPTDKDGDSNVEVIEHQVSDVKECPEFKQFEDVIRIRQSAFSDQFRMRKAYSILNPDKTYYALNWTKKEYVQMNGCPIYDDEWPVRIDPLFILCSVGNGRGGGDYRGDNLKLAGAWAFDQIEVCEDKPKGDEWTEIKPMFRMD